MQASHVVVDLGDGYTFTSGSDGQLFTAEAAVAFAEQRNAERKPQYRTYMVFALVPHDPATAAIVSALADGRVSAG